MIFGQANDQDDGEYDQDCLDCQDDHGEDDHNYRHWRLKSIIYQDGLWSG